MKFSNLNKSQKIAITANKGPKLVIAGAGTGKTEVLSFRFFHLVKHMNVDPSRILVITFSKSAGKNMKNRIFSKTSNYRNLWIGHIHSIVKQALESWEYETKGDKWKILNASLAMEKIKGWVDFNKYKDLDFEAVIEIIATIKVKRYEQKEVDMELLVKKIVGDYTRIKKGKPDFEQAIELYEVYRRKLKEKKMWDFTDLIIEFHRKITTDEDIGFRNLWSNKFDFILFDEFQDINKIQLEIIYALNRDGNIFCVGDPDQSIYGFRGSVPDVFLEFKNYWELKGKNVEIIKLLNNYRSTPEIINISNALIADNYKDRENLLKKELVTSNPRGEPVELYRGNSRNREVDWVIKNITYLRKQGVDLGSICILGRVRDHYKDITKKLVQNSIPCTSNEIFENVKKNRVRNWIALIGFVITKKDDVEKRDEHLIRIMNFDQTITPHMKKRVITAANEKGIPVTQQMRNISNPKFQIDDIDAKLGNLWRKLISLKNACKGNTAIVKMKKCVLAYKMWKRLTKEEIDEHKLNLDILSRTSSIARQLNEYQMEDKADLKELEDSLMNKVNMISTNNKVSLMTIHKSKGLEWDYVFITRMDDGKIPHKKSISESNERVMEERRLAYVAFTRAKKKLFISSSGFKNGKSNISRFICEGTIVWEHPDLKKLDLDLAPVDSNEVNFDPGDVESFNKEFSRCLNNLGNENDWDDNYE